MAINKVVQREAYAAANAARRNMFRSRSREMGGYTSATKARIDKACDNAAKAAIRAVYMDHGYRPCASESCDAMCSPTYTICPGCEAARQVAGDIHKAPITQVAKAMFMASPGWQIERM